MKNLPVPKYEKSKIEDRNRRIEEMRNSTFEKKGKIENCGLEKSNIENPRTEKSKKEKVRIGKVKIEIKKIEKSKN